MIELMNNELERMWKTMKNLSLFAGSGNNFT
jgi:hypothetical protein